MIGEEIVVVVDDDDRVVGAATRCEMRARNLRHRCTSILCRNPMGDVYVHRRTESKDVYPGMYDVFFGGVVAAGESYEEGARRELAEEAGIEGAALVHRFTAPYEDDESRSITAVYEVVWDGPIRHQESEVAWGAWIPLERAVAMLD